MKVAIHENETGFAQRWIEFCKKNGIEFILVNAYENDIVEKLSGIDVFLWHYHHACAKDALVAKKILFALEHAGIGVFPDFRTGWHFDDKIAQKYLLEALNIPLVKSYVFYDRKQALLWAERTDFPKVFKLKGGAGSANVRLVKSLKEAKGLINTSFTNGFSQFDRFGYAKERYKKFLDGKDTLLGVFKGIARILVPPKFAREQPKERGYIYFQDFIPGNDSDIRVIVIGNRAFAVKRMTRKGDFRASGSGNIKYSSDDIDLRCVRLAFEINRKIKSKCIAFDFIFDVNRNPLVVEVSYGFSVNVYDQCPGYWDSSLAWHEGRFVPQYWMIEDAIRDFSDSLKNSLEN